MGNLFVNNDDSEDENTLEAENTEVQKVQRQSRGINDTNQGQSRCTCCEEVESTDKQLTTKRKRSRRRSKSIEYDDREKSAAGHNCTGPINHGEIIVDLDDDEEPAGTKRQRR